MAGIINKIKSYPSDTTHGRQETHLILAYFVFFSLFISLRILLIGADASASLAEYAFSALPDLFVLFILFVMLLKTNIKLFYRQLSFFDKVVIIYAVTNVIYGTILAGDLKLSTYAFRMSYLPIAFYFIARLWSSPDADLYEKLFHKIVIWNLVIAIIGLMIYFVFTDFYDYMMLKGNLIDEEYYIRRMGSLFWTPVVFASFMVFSGFYCYYKALSEGKWYYYLLFGIFWSCLFLTVSRGAIISFFAGLIILAIIMKHWKGFLISFLVMAFVIFCFWLLDQVVTNILAFIFDSAFDTLRMKRGITRVELWIHAWNDFLHRPWGYGLGKAGHVASRFFGKYSPDAATFSTDGWYLKILNETGVWGLFSYLALLISYFIQSIRYLKRKRQGFYLFLFVSIIIVAIQNIVSNTNDFYLFASLIWLMIGVSQSLYIKLKHEQA